MKLKINSIRCKYCNKPLGCATQGCNCMKKMKWNNPAYKRKTIERIKKFKKLL